MTDQSEKRQRSRDSGGSPFSSRGWIVWMVVLMLASLWLFSRGDAGDGTSVSYSAFRQQVREGNVASVTVSGEEISGRLQAARTTEVDGQSVHYTQFVTYLPSFGDEGLLELLEQQGVTVSVEPPDDYPLSLILVNVLPFILLLVLGYFLLRGMQRGGRQLFSMGKSKAKLYDQSQEQTTFDDVAGASGAKAELTEIIAYLKDPQRFQRLGGDPPSGVLLVGPPGTGKTLLARAVAGEAAVPFFSISGSDFMEMFVGVGASRVRNLFQDAVKNAPSIIFIDELDSIGRLRGAGLGGGHDEREQTLNQLLSEMDGFEPHESVIVMAATNRPDILDPALMRPGRFDRRITVDLPTVQSREEILEIHARNKPLADDVDLSEVARATPGFSGADLKNLLNEGALLAGRDAKHEVERADIEAARDKIILGLEREGMALTDEERRLLAYHEGGHAVVAAVLPNCDPVHKVTIVPRGRAMGVTQQLPEREKYIYSRDYMMDRMAMMMGGRAAEDLVFGTATSGAEQDFSQATQLARRMVLSWGMSDRLGRVSLDGQRQNVFLGEEIASRRDFSEATAREVDEEIKLILDSAYESATDALIENRAGLDALAEELLEEEEVDGSKVLELLGLSRDEAGEPQQETPTTATPVSTQ